MGRIPIEYDLASNATPNDIKNMFEKTTNVGEKFGTICIHKKKKVIEITLLLSSCPAEGFPK